MARRARASGALLSLIAVTACQAGTTSVGSFSPDEGVAPSRPAAASDVTLQRVTRFGPAPVFSALTGYSSTEPDAAVAVQAPGYAPYNSTDPAWWDNLVAEQSQARLARIMFPTRGSSTLDSSDLSGPGDMNPRRLTAWVDALQRADALTAFNAGCYVDTPFLVQLSNALHGNAPGTPLDLSVQSDWSDVFWLRAIKPWFDTVPSSLWWTLSDDTPGGVGAPVIQLGPLNGALFENQAANASQMLTYIAAQFATAYGAAPVFVLDESWFAVDSSVTQLATVVGNSPAFSAPDTPSAFSNFKQRTWGTAVAGFTDPSYYDTASPNYQAQASVIPRKVSGPNGSSVPTLLTGLSGASQAHAITMLQGFTDYGKSAGLYRSASAAWDFPNQYLNLIRRYSDLRTVTLRLEAEGCDRYRDTTRGNSGGAFLRAGDLDVRKLSSGTGWAVTSTAPGEWIEFSDVDFSPGNYRFSANLSTTARRPANETGKRLQMAIDGVSSPPVLVPYTPDADTFEAVVLGQATMSYGPHTLRLKFLDAELDLDWLFLKKSDSLVALQTSAGFFVTAVGGGNGPLVGDVRDNSIYEKYSFDDLNGGTLTAGDSVNIQAFDGFYLTADTTSGALSASAFAPGPNELFTVQNLTAAGDILSGQSIALLAADGLHYVTVGANNQLDVSGTSVTAAQTFTASLSDQ